MNEKWVKFKEEFLAEKKANDAALLTEARRLLFALSEQHKAAIAEVAEVVQELRQESEQGRRR